MTEALNLYVEQNENGQWSVYYREAGMGRNTLEVFDDRQEAIDFAQDQIDTAEFPADEIGLVIVNDIE